MDHNNSNPTPGETQNIRGAVKNKLKDDTDYFAWRISFPDEVIISKTSMTKDVSLHDETEQPIACEFGFDKLSNSILITPFIPFNINTNYYLRINGVETVTGTRQDVINIGFIITEDKKLQIFGQKGDAKKVSLSKMKPIRQIRLGETKLEYLGKQDCKYSFGLLKFTTVIFLVRYALDTFHTIADASTMESINKAALYIIVAASLLQAVLFIKQFRSNKKVSIDVYNRGVLLFNAGRIRDANSFFLEAFNLDSRNIHAAKGLELCGKYHVPNPVASIDKYYFERLTYSYNYFFLVACGLFNLFYVTSKFLFAMSTDFVDFFFVFTWFSLIGQILITTVQRLDPKHNSYKLYNQAIDIFESGNKQAAYESFRAAARKSPLNSHAIRAREVLKEYIAMK